MYEKYAKDGGAARRRFIAISEKPFCVVKMTPPPGRRLTGHQATLILTGPGRAPHVTFFEIAVEGVGCPSG